MIRFIKNENAGQYINQHVGDRPTNFDSFNIYPATSTTFLLKGLVLSNLFDKLRIFGSKNAFKSMS